MPVIVPRGSPLPPSQRPTEARAISPSDYAAPLRHYERQLEIVNEQLDREWEAYISGRSAFRYRHKTKRRLVYLEGMIARIKYIHLPALEPAPACKGPPTERDSA